MIHGERLRAKVGENQQAVYNDEQPYPHGQQFKSSHPDQDQGRKRLCKDASCLALYYQPKNAEEASLDHTHFSTPFPNVPHYLAPNAEHHEYHAQSLKKAPLQAAIRTFFYYLIPLLGPPRPFSVTVGRFRSITMHRHSEQ